MMRWKKIGYHLWSQDWSFASTLLLSVIYLGNHRLFFEIISMIGTSALTSNLFQNFFNCFSPKSEIFLIDLTISLSKTILILLIAVKLSIMSNYKVFYELVYITYKPLSKGWGVFMVLFQSHGRKIRTDFVKWKIPFEKVFVYIGMLLFKIHKIEEVHSQPFW